MSLGINLSSSTKKARENNNNNNKNKQTNKQTTTTTTTTNSVSCLRRKGKKLRTMPLQEQRKGHEVRNENIQRYSSVRFPLKAVKFEILRIHEDNIITTIFYLNVTQ